MNVIGGQTESTRPASAAHLVVRASSKAYAIPISHVVETMRPLPIAPVTGMPEFVLGLSLIRGAPVPVVDVDSLVGSRRTEEISRFVLLRVAERSVALAVGAVVGIRDLDAAHLQEMPPLLSNAGADVIEAVGVLDARLLLVFRASRLVPEEISGTLSMPWSPS
jgi:purine-binding chemotaxis protein CheW